MSLDCPACTDGELRVVAKLGKHHRRGREDLTIYQQARAVCRSCDRGPFIGDRLPGGTWTDWRKEPRPSRPEPSDDHPLRGTFDPDGEKTRDEIAAELSEQAREPSPWVRSRMRDLEIDLPVTDRGAAA